MSTDRSRDSVAVTVRCSATGRKVAEVWPRDDGAFNVRDRTTAQVWTADGGGFNIRDRSSDDFWDQFQTPIGECGHAHEITVAMMTGWVSRYRKTGREVKIRLRSDDPT